MPLGSSDGQVYKNRIDYLSQGSRDNNVIDPDTTPDLGTQDQNIVPPKDSRMPLGSPTEPAGTLKVSGGSQTPEKPSETNPLLPEGSFPDLLHLDPNKDIDIVKGFYDTVKNAFKLPGDVYAGKINPMSRQGIERAADLAGLMVTGPAPVAEKMAEGTLGSFMGVKSKSFDFQKAKEAIDLEKAGTHPDEIWEKTQTFRGADQKWRQEIDDSTAKVNPDWASTPPEDIFKQHGIALDTSYGRYGENNTYSLRKWKTDEKINPEELPDALKDVWKDLQAGTVTKSLPEVLDHPDLYEAYPWLKDTKVIQERNPPYAGVADKDTNSIRLHQDYAQNKSVMLHELQHLIQGHEGFAAGGAPAHNFALRFDEDVEKAALENFDIYHKKGLWSKEDLATYDRNHKILQLDALRRAAAVEKSRENYERLAGEVESRNTQSRMGLNKEERALAPPESTEDVPRSNQAVKKQAVWATPYGYGNPMEPPPYATIPGQFTPYSKRWPNNDNVRTLNEHEQFIKDYDELHALGESLGTPTKWGSNKWSEIDTQKYNKAGRAFAKKHNLPWTDVPFNQ